MEKPQINTGITVIIMRLLSVEIIQFITPYKPASIFGQNQANRIPFLF